MCPADLTSRELTKDSIICTDRGVADIPFPVGVDGPVEQAGLAAASAAEHDYCAPFLLQLPLLILLLQLMRVFQGLLLLAGVVGVARGGRRQVAGHSRGGLSIVSAWEDG